MAKLFKLLGFMYELEPIKPIGLDLVVQFVQLAHDAAAAAAANDDDFFCANKMRNCCASSLSV